LGGFEDFKRSGSVSGLEGYNRTANGILDTVLKFKGYFVNRIVAVGRLYYDTGDFFILEDCGQFGGFALRDKRIIPFYGDYIFPLRDYPVREILAVWQTHALKETIIVEPELYHTIPECPETKFPRELEDIPFTLSVSSALRLVRNLPGLKVHYRAGYSPGKVPPDLASACLELAAWNMSRYRGRRIGLAGNVRGSGKEGEHLEISMPEQVRHLLEPYQRRII
jgi:hypothetical protein